MGHRAAGISASAQETENPVSLGHAHHPVAGLQDYSGEFQARDVRRAARRGWIAALPLQHVGAVQGGSLHVDQNVLGAGDRVIDLHYLQDFGTAGLGNNGCAHLFLPL